LDDVGGGFAGHEGQKVFFAFGVVFAVACDEFAEVRYGFAFGACGADHFEMFEHDLALFGQCRVGGYRFVVPQGTDLSEDPWIADGAASDDDAVEG